MGPTWQELVLIRGRDIRKLDPGTGCLIFILFVTCLVLFWVARFIYAADFKLVSLYIMLAPGAVWLFLTFCGGAFNSQEDFRFDRPTCRSCCSCLACLVFGGIIALVLDIMILSHSHHKPENKVNFNASNVTLTRFNFTTSNNSTILGYHLSLNISVGPNKQKTGVFYHSIQASAFYQGQNFTSLSIPPFYLGGNKNHTYNSTVVLHPVFQGQQVVVLAGDGLKRYQEATAARCYSIKVTLSYEGIRTNDYNDSMIATDSNDRLNNAGHQLKGVVTFALELPLSSDVTNGIALAHSGATKSFEY